MKEFVQHPIYGEIVYNESIWTGKKTLTINGVNAKQVSKKEFTVEGKKVVIIGNSLIGVKVHIDNDTVEVSPKPKWYEIVFAVLPFIFLLTWGNSAVLCSVFPVVGGAIGGALGAIGSMTSLLFMKKSKSLLPKLLIGIGTFVGTVLIAFLLALLMIPPIA